MKYKLLGRSGLRVSEICLGTMTFGEDWGWGSTKRESKKVFNAFVEAGGNFFDTANTYTQGTSEVYLGDFVSSERERFVIASKYTMSTNPSDPNAGGNQRKNLMQSVHASLKRLCSDYIDLLWVHAWDKYTPIDEMMRGLDDLVKQGKVLYIGASNIPAWAVAKANTMADAMGWTPFVALQLEYSLVERTIEREYFDLANYLDLAIVPWSPLGMGVLTGKYLSNQEKSGRFEALTDPWKKRYFSERNQKIVQTTVEIAKEMGKRPVQVALNWVRQKNKVSIPIIGAKNGQQLLENLACLSFKLTDEQMERLDQVSAISLGFPHDFLTMENMGQIIYGNTKDLLEPHR